MPVNEKDLAELLTIDEVAELLRVTRRTVQRMIARHDLDVIRGPNMVRITKRAALDWANRHAVPAAKPPRDAKAG